MFQSIDIFQRFLLEQIIMWVIPKIMVPQNGWFIMENPIKMDDLGVPLFLETPMCPFNFEKIILEITLRKKDQDQSPQVCQKNKTTIWVTSEWYKIWNVPLYAASYSLDVHWCARIFQHDGTRVWNAMPPKIMDLDTKTCFVSFARLVFFHWTRNCRTGKKRYMILHFKSTPDE